MWTMTMIAGGHFAVQNPVDEELAASLKRESNGSQSETTRIIYINVSSLHAYVCLPCDKIADC